MKIPKLFQRTRSYKNLMAYMKTTFTEVLHTTLNPEGPGAIRIHLIPPKFDDERIWPSVAIINGSDILPVNPLWAILVAELIQNTNRYDGKPLSEDLIEGIVNDSVAGVKKLVPYCSAARLHKDLETIYDTFRQIALREPVTADVKYLSIGDYADHMRAPHRMDVMVSAMTKGGHWNCNQKCVHCYAAGQECAEEKELSTEEWKQILDRLKDAGVPQVTFTGGEPTMREDLLELIRYARWFISRLNTNGIRLTKEYCEKLREAELDSLQITLYSTDSAVHNRLVGAEQFENTFAGIRNALEAGLCVSINTPLCSLNRDYLSTLKTLHEMGVYYVTCSGLITTGNAALEASEKLQLSSEELKAILREAVEYCHANEMEIAFTSPGWIEGEFCDERNISVPSCGACLSNMAVTPGGNVVPCQSWLSEKPLGNMLTDDWEKIWDSTECESFRNYSATMSGKCPLRRYCNA